MKKVLLFLIVGLLLCGCGKEEKTYDDKLKDLGYEVIENGFKKDTITIKKQLNLDYNSQDVLIEDKIGDNYTNTDLYLKTIKVFINIPDEVVTKGLDNLLDAVKENKRSSEINIYNKQDYYFSLFLTEDKTLKITIITPRTYNRAKDDTYMTIDDGYGKDYYSAFRRSSNTDKNLEYDKLVISKIYNNERVNIDEVKELLSKHDLCNTDLICQRYLAFTETNISVLAKNGVYSVTYDMTYANSGTYLLTEHKVEDFELGVSGDLDIVQKRAKNNVTQYKDIIVKAYTDKDYKLVYDDNHDGIHYEKTLKLSEDFTVDMDIYEDTIEISYGYHGE